MSADWDAAERGMTPDEWADVFKVGADTFGRTRDFGAALLAMSAACKGVERARESRHG